MNISDFKVGDKVISDASKDYWHSGREGEVVNGLVSSMVLVRFKDYRGGRGHSGANEFGSNNTQHWNFAKEASSDDALLTLLEPVIATAMEVKAAKTRAAPHGKQEYRGNGKHEWEKVADAASTQTSDTVRLRVPGGWVYKAGIGVAFVPTPAVIGYKV